MFYGRVSLTFICETCTEEESLCAVVTLSHKTKRLGFGVGSVLNSYSQGVKGI